MLSRESSSIRKVALVVVRHINVAHFFSNSINLRALDQFLNYLNMIP